jgi:hypothetical protein
MGEFERAKGFERSPLPAPQAVADFGDDILHELRPVRAVVDVAVPENFDRLFAGPFAGLVVGGAEFGPVAYWLVTGLAVCLFVLLPPPPRLVVRLLALRLMRLAAETSEIGFELLERIHALT